VNSKDAVTLLNNYDSNFHSVHSRGEAVPVA
jgi:hypothetical protein